MLEKNNYIELFVNGEGVEFDSQDSINIRINDIIFDPTKIETTQATYSYEFSLPCTAKNNKIFDYANNLSRLDKFHKRWNAQLYADGSLIFDGSMALRGVDDGYYQCNLVNYKIDTIEDIFGDAVLSDIPWEMEFNGVDTINECNSADTSTVTFPFVSYGAFQKMPYNSDEVAQDYTSKYVLDQYNLWYIESFPPSINPIELIKKAYEWKGYKVQGDALRDYFLNNIFMSMSLADGQDPLYNLGNPRFGKVDITVTWENPMDTSGDSGETFGTVQDLQHPYFLINNPDATTSPEWSSEWPRVKLGENENLVTTDPIYNFDKIRVYDMLLAQDGGSYTINDPTYLFNPVEHCIFVPTDGFYKITLEYDAKVTTNSDITAKQWVRYYNMFNGYNASFGPQEEDITFHPNIVTTTPLEIQLVRNYDNNIELIKGFNNFIIMDGMPDNTTVSNEGQAPNYVNFTSAFPHEPWGKQLNDIALPYNENDTKISPWANFHLDKYLTKWEYPTDKKTDNVTYYPRPSDVMAYDPAVSPVFIAGVTSMGNMQGIGTNAVVKNGYSWSRSVAERTDNFYNNNGYINLTVSNGNTYNYKYTNWNQNSLQGIPQNTFSESTAQKRIYGNVNCIVKLNKNDRLQLFGIHRDYQTKDGDPVSYQSSANCHVVIEAISPKSMQQLKKENFNWNSPIDFDVNLKLGNFLNKETKISDWINDFCNAFNLETSYYNNTVSFDKRTNSIGQAVVDIDDRANTENAKSSIIDYPKEMAVKYKIDEEEHGFYASVPSDKIEEEDWKKYGDYGYTVIQLNDDAYVSTKEEKQLNYSYCWYDNFNWIPIGRNHEDTGDLGDEQTLTIPVISKEEWMIDGYDYAESMKHDGFGLTQRFWYRPTIDSMQAPWVWTDTYPQEKIWLYTTRNVDKGLYLSYKANEYSLLKNYFNIKAELSSNYVEVDVYLTPDEYNMLKNGCLVRFDKDLYAVVEINGYDAANNNMTTLKLMKKTTPSDITPMVDQDFHTRYRWVPSGWQCSGYTKVTQENKQVSFDDGVTWIDIVPYETRGALPVIEYFSADCGYEPIPEAIYRWGDSGTTCIGYDKWQNSVYQVSLDNGVTWTNVEPITYSATSLIEANSEDCGYEPDWSKEYLTFVTLSNDGFIQFNSNLYYSKNGSTWGTGVSRVDVVQGDIVKFKGNLKNNYFSYSSGKYDLKGNIMSVVYGDEFIGKTDLDGAVFNGEFNGNGWRSGTSDTIYKYLKIRHLKDLVLPATILSEGCYETMFTNQLELESLPKQLPATTLVKNCYTHMFSCQNGTMSEVTSYITIPQGFLPATVMADSGDSYYGYGCYEKMFAKRKLNISNGFMSATTLTPYCMLGMFSGSSINSVPNVLMPATTMASHCCEEMFYGCSFSSSVVNNGLPSGFLQARVLAESCFESMFENSNIRSFSDLQHVTTLAYGCCRNMFSGLEYPRLNEFRFPSSSVPLAPYCFEGMFNYCMPTNGGSLPILLATTLAEGCYKNMYRNLNNGWAYAPERNFGIPSGMLPATTLAPYCYEGMFAGAQGCGAIPENLLPATTLAEGCYKLMFNMFGYNNSNDLSSSPILRAQVLQPYCYYDMFNSCFVPYVKCLAEDISADHCLGYNNYDATTCPSGSWYFGISGYRTFYKSPYMNDWCNDYNHCSCPNLPDNFTIQDYQD